MNTLKKDLRPWETVSVDGTRTTPSRTVRIAHANMNKAGRDERWPPGSAMNPIQPGQSTGQAAVERMLGRVSNNVREDNN